MVSPAVKFEDHQREPTAAPLPTKTVEYSERIMPVWPTDRYADGGRFLHHPLLPRRRSTNAVPDTASSNMMSIAGADSSGNFTYDSKTNITAASDEGWTVTISSKNYTDITGTLTFKLVDKTDVSAQITFPNAAP